MFFFFTLCNLFSFGFGERGISHLSVERSLNTSSAVVMITGYFRMVSRKLSGLFK